MNHTIKSILFGAALAATLGGCGGSTDSSGPLGNIDSLVILQRVRQNDTGDIFQYTSYTPGARLVKLEPPTADGQLTVLCCDKAGADFAAIDINSYDIAFDAKTIVFSGKKSASDAYGLFILNLADGSVTQLATDPSRDYVTPIFLPDNKIMFTTNAVVEQGAPQHRDEYERGTTSQLGIIDVAGTNEQLGPRNLSHRTAPSLMSDGRVIFTQWDHLGPENSGHLMFVDTDMTNLREAFGKEGTGASNSTLKAIEIAPGRVVSIATARNRTINSGALIDVRLGTPSTDSDGNVRADTSMSEAHASFELLTPDVPTGNEPSTNTVGRYYDAYPLNAKEKPDLLVSWADGPVETSSLAAAGLSANFGVYLYDSEHQARRPILDDPNYWDIFARPLQTRTAPNAVGAVADGTLGGQTLIGAMNVYTSTLHQFNPGEIYGVRVMEGFSSEEGFPREFGTTKFEGHAQLAVAPIAADGSWLATVPANVPLHLQTVDKFGMSIFNEPVWFSGRSGESRVCGGCHEDRAASTIINPGITDAAAIGPTPAFGLTPRDQRLSNDFSRDKIMGVAWDKALQPMFDAKCIGCHNGDPNLKGPDGKLANPTYTLTDPKTGTSTTHTFNLTGAAVQIALGTDLEMQTFTESYLTMAGPDMEAIAKQNIMVSGDFKVYLNPEDAHGSIGMQVLNPPVQFPTPNTATRAFDGQTHAQVMGFTDLTPDEYYALILAADMGANFYSRENNPHDAN